MRWLCRPTWPCRPTTSPGARAARPGAPVAGRSDDWQLDVRTRLLDGIFALVEGHAGGRDTMLAIVGAAVDRIDEIHSSGFSNLAYLDVEQRRLPEAAAVLGVSLPLTVEFDLPICHVWQLGARGRLGLLQGDWQAAERDAAAVLARPARRSRGPGPTWSAAWSVSAAPATPAPTWTTRGTWRPPRRAAAADAGGVRPRRARLAVGVPDARVGEAVRLLRRFDGVGLEWARGDLAVGCGGSTPCCDRRPRGVRAASAAVVRPAAEAATAWEQLTPCTTRRWHWSRPRAGRVPSRDSPCSTDLGADAVAARVRQGLRDRGVTNIPARRRAATLTNAVGLTAREVEVLDPARRGPQQRRARRAPLHLAEDRRPPCVGDPVQAAGREPAAGSPCCVASSASSPDSATIEA